MKSTTLLLLACVLVLAGCAGTSRDSLTREEAAYATTYLGPDGRVIVDPRAGSATARKAWQGGPSEMVQQTGTWEGDGVSGAPSIVIDLSEQEARFYKGGQLVGTSPVSTGREGYRTPSGSYRVTQKNADHYSNLYGDYVDEAGNVVVPNVGVQRDPRPPGTRFRGAPMPFFMRVHGAVGMHGGYLPGYPASHGCIRLPMRMAEIYFANAPIGTPVRIIH
ncbi:MAG: hypothetical protein Fur0032_07580 [Terrimicrobiaceae bacterium]